MPATEAPSDVNLAAVVGWTTVCNTQVRVVLTYSEIDWETKLAKLVILDER